MPATTANQLAAAINGTVPRHRPWRPLEHQVDDVIARAARTTMEALFEQAHRANERLTYPYRNLPNWPEQTDAFDDLVDAIETAAGEARYR